MDFDLKWRGVDYAAQPSRTVTAVRSCRFFAPLPDGWSDIKLEIKSGRLTATNRESGERLWFTENGAALKHL